MESSLSKPAPLLTTHRAWPMPAHAEDLNLRDGKEARAIVTHSQDPQGSLWTAVLGTTECMD